MSTPNTLAQRPKFSVAINTEVYQKLIRNTLGDPDRAKRKVMYDDVVAAFPGCTVFIGGSSSFDIAPYPYNKYYALDQYCKAHGLTHDEVAYVGDDYGIGGNDEQVYNSDIRFFTVNDYRKLEEALEELL